MSSYNASSVSQFLSYYGIPTIANGTELNSTNLTSAQAETVMRSLGSPAANLTIQRANATYGSISYSGRYKAAGKGYYYLERGKQGEVLYNVTIAKATPILSVNIDGFTVSAPNTTVIHIPVVNGHVGISGGSTYPISGSLSSSLLDSLNMTYNISEGSRKVAGSSLNASALDLPLKLSIPLNQNTTIRFDAEGNANYTSVDPTVIIIPTSIVYTLPITFTNTAGTALTANTPLAVGVAGGAVTGFNALAYQQYELPSLNNTEFFYANGTIVPSWMEGNMINELTANGIATSITSMNALGSSANVLFWVKIGQNAPNFLPANTGTATTNTIYMGFAGNVITAGNVLFNTATTGEAPQLSCSNPYSTSTCGAYGQYDIGNSIFTFYDNFHGTVLNTSKWSITHIGNPLTVANSLELGETTVTSGRMISATSYSGYPYWFGGLLLPSTTSSTTKEFGFEESNTLTFGTSAYEKGYFIGTNTVGNIIPISSGSTGAVRFNAVLTASASRPNVLGVAWTSTGVTNNQYNYNTNAITSNGYAIGGQFFSVIVSESASATYDGFAQWVRAMVYPPNGILPGTSFGAVPCTVIMSPPANAEVDVGQTESFTVTEQGCASPYVYNVFVSNAVSGLATVNNDLVGSTSSTSFTYTFTTAAGDTSNSPERANVVLTDAGSNTATQYSSNFLINNLLSVPAPRLVTAGSSVYVGQPTGIVASWSGGSSPYTVNYIISNSVTNNVLLSQLVTGVASTSNVFVWLVPQADIGNTIEVNAVLTDSAGIPVTANSVYTSAYTVSYMVPPSGVNYYLPITLSNGQSTNTTANFQQSFSFNAIQICNSILCAPYLNNTEFFFQNGTLINSWYESANGLLNNYGSNSFSASSNVLAWLLIPPANFIPAFGVNTVYMGFETNTINNFNAIGAVGEAPQLTCPNPGNTVLCGTYGNYDNGNQVFMYYNNFKSPSNIAGWGSANSTSTASNGLTVVTASGSNWAGLSSNTVYSIPYIDEEYVANVFSAAFFATGLSPNTIVGSNQGGYNVLTLTQGAGGSSFGGYYYKSGSSQNFGNCGSSSQDIAGIPSITVFSNYTVTIGFSSFTEQFACSLSTTGINPGPSYHLFVGGSASSGGRGGIANWVRLRTIPPNGIQPTIVQGLVEPAAVADSCYISLSNTLVSFGSINPGANVPTTNAIQDTDSGGNSAATIFIAGGVGNSATWYGNAIWLGTSGSNTIGISNTLYSASSQASYTGTQVTNAITSTGITIPNPAGGSSSNVIFLGMAVPGGTPSDVYTANIVIENSC